jgi:hypothetical protein
MCTHTKQIHTKKQQFLAKKRKGKAAVAPQLAFLIMAVTGIVVATIDTAATINT